MKINFLILGLAQAVIPESTPCPSVDCWTYDADTKQCTLKSDCVKLDCGATKITMSVKEGVFADDSETVTGAVVDDDGYFNVECNLGDECETHSFSADGTTLSFATKIEVTGDARTRSVDNNEIDLGGGLKVITSPFGVGVDFTCDYMTSVELTSSPFAVQDVSISGTHSSSGTLDGGFTLTAGDESTIILGDDITLKTAWSLNLSDVSPHYESCSVTHGAKTVAVVKEGCMAATLGAELVANDSGVTNEVSMKYKTFSVEDETATTQTVTCNVKLCTGAANCAYTDAATCFTADDPFGYQ